MLITFSKRIGRNVFLDECVFQRDLVVALDFLDCLVKVLVLGGGVEPDSNDRDTRTQWQK